jgi:glycosyltransferase involved in cell wall biosynthesis
VGGSLTGILELLPYLDRSRYEPALVLAEKKPGVELANTPIHVLAPRVRRCVRERAARRSRGRCGGGAGVFGRPAPRERAGPPLHPRAAVARLPRERAQLEPRDGGRRPARTGVPVVCHFKGFRRIGPVDRFLSRWIDVAISMTDEIARHYQERHVHARRFVTIYDGIEPSRFVTGGGAAVRREFGIPDDAPSSASSGHVQEWKGQLLVAEAVARARRTIPALRCLIDGGIPSLRCATARALKERIARPDSRATSC